MKKNLANIITAVRIPLSAALLFTPVLGTAFFVVYSLCGLSDMADGFVARRTGTVSETGSKLDSAADIVFVIVCLYRFLPVLDPEPWMWVCTGLIAAVKVYNMTTAFFRKRPLPHTVLNKAAGLALFALPFTLKAVPLACSAPAVLAVAAAAAVHEGFVLGKKDIPEKKDDG